MAHLVFHSPTLPFSLSDNRKRGIGSRLVALATSKYCQQYSATYLFVALSTLNNRTPPYYFVALLHNSLLFKRLHEGEKHVCNCKSDIGKGDSVVDGRISVNYLSHIPKQSPYPSQPISLFVAHKENMFPICRKHLTNLSHPTSLNVAPPY